jgi:aminoglycoside 6-adenylyltransferase
MKYPQRYQNWMAQFVEWAKPRQDIRAALIFGSQARKGNDLADNWSDLDLAIFTSKPGLYTSSNSWMREISPMWSGLIDTSEVWDGAAVASGFSVYEGGLIVDTVILPTARAQLALACISLLKWIPSLWRQMDHPIIRFCSGMTEFFRGGTIIMLDKDGLARRLESIAGSIPQIVPPPLSAKQFQENADAFWVDPPRVAANLRRGRLVWSIRSFTPLLRQLYTMSEWHARAKHAWDDERQYPPKMIEKWADTFIVEAFPQIHPRYDPDALWRALLALMNVYRRITVETAGLLGYNYDATSAEYTSAWVEKCHQETME